MTERPCERGVRAHHGKTVDRSGARVWDNVSPCVPGFPFKWLSPSFSHSVHCRLPKDNEVCFNYINKAIWHMGKALPLACCYRCICRPRHPGPLYAANRLNQCTPLPFCSCKCPPRFLYCLVASVHIWFLGIIAIIERSCWYFTDVICILSIILSSSRI